MVMDGHNLSRKRKSDNEADEANAVLRRALATRPTSAPWREVEQRSHSDTNKVKKPAVKAAKRSPADLMRLRSIVDGRVNNWKSRQAPETQFPTKQSSYSGSNRAWESGSSSRSPHIAPTKPPTNNHSDGVFQRFVNEDSTTPPRRRREKSRVKRRHHGEGGPGSTDRRHRSIKSRAEANIKVKTEHSDAVGYRRPEQFAANEGSEMRTIKTEPGLGAETALQPIKQEPDDSSDESGIVGIVDTRRNREAYG